MVFYFSPMNQNHQSITLNNFEQVIDSRILERGFEYYKNDAILSIEQIEKGIWEAVVSGSEEYEIAIHFQNNIIINSNCTCPYDLTNFCKHKIAIFNFLKYSDQAKHPPSDKMKKVRSILESFTPEELKDNLLEILKYNNVVRENFLEENDNYGS